MALPQTKINALLEDFEGFERLSEFELERLKRRVQATIEEVGLLAVLAKQAWWILGTSKRLSWPDDSELEPSHPASRKSTPSTR